MEKASKTIGRFAPTPSGRLHLGNVLCALLSYLSAKKEGGEFIIRIEDLDPDRSSRELAYGILRDLEKLGLKSDAQPLWQSERTAAYAAAEEKLAAQGLLYPCFCSRSRLRLPPNKLLPDGSVVYGGTCRTLTQAQIQELRRTRSPAVHLKVPNAVYGFTDGMRGRVEQNLGSDCGDFAIRRADGVYTYQLAVVVDDSKSGVTQIVRGEDLLSSTPRQLYIMDLLGLPHPKYYHIPLLRDDTGRKLSKSEGDSLGDLLKRKSPQSVLGALGFACGLLPTPAPISLPELVAAFDWKNVTGKFLLPTYFL